MVTDMVRPKAEFMAMRFKQVLLSWDKEFGVGMNRVEAEPFLALADALIKNRIAAEPDPF